MSYALELAADANRALLSLPVDVQEEAHEIVDRVAAEAAAGAAATEAGTGDVVARQERLVYRTDALACDVYLYYTIAHSRRTVRLDRIAAVIFEDR